MALFKAGVQGCCKSDVDPQLLKRIVVAVQQGELWIRRSITPRLLDKLGARLRNETPTTRVIAGRLAALTVREREIAELIGNGESNNRSAVAHHRADGKSPPDRYLSQARDRGQA